MSSSPRRAWMLRSFTVSVTCAPRSGSGMRAAALLDVDEVVVPEAAYRGSHRGAGRRAERADGGPPGRPAQTDADAVAHLPEQVDGLEPALTALDPGQQLLLPPGPLPARGALPARLVGEEPHNVPGGPH